MSRSSLSSNPLEKGVIVLSESEDSRITDRYRLLFAKLDIISQKEEKRIIAITSAVKGEGKTTTSSNLAVVAARDFGKRSLIIDGDFKNPSLGNQFGLQEKPGLINVIEKECLFDEAIVEGLVQNLTVLPMGKTGKRDDAKRNHIWAADGIIPVLKRVRKLYDYIWVDAPPILPMFDMSVVSEAVDGILLVVRAGETQESVLTQAVKSMGSEKIIGSVLNRVKTSLGHGYYGYKHGRYDYNS